MHKELIELHKSGEVAKYVEDNCNTSEMSCKDHIAVFKGAMTELVCQHFIDVCNTESEMTSFYQRNNGKVNQDTAVGINSDDASPGVVVLHTMLWEAFYTYLVKYLPWHEQKNNFYISGINVQRTLPGEGYHAWHYEAADASSNDRFAVFTLYLNDVEDGGETEFLHQSVRVKPSMGELCFFPAQYTHIHRGNPPLKETKYIITGWFNYMYHPKNI